jgi:hypothetical protein
MIKERKLLILKAIVVIAFAIALQYVIAHGVETDIPAVNVLLGIVGAYLIYKGVNAHVEDYRAAKADYKKDKSWSNMKGYVPKFIFSIITDVIILNLYIKGAWWFYKAFSPYAHGLF